MAVAAMLTGLTGLAPADVAGAPSCVARWTGAVADQPPATKAALLRFLADAAVAHPRLRAAMEVGRGGVCVLVCVRLWGRGV